MISVPVAAGLALDGHDLAVLPFSHAVCDPVATEGQNVLQVPLNQTSNLAHRG